MAYPSVITLADYFCDTLRATTNNLNVSVLGHCFGKDHRFAETISHVVSPPMSILLLFLIFDVMLLGTWPISFLFFSFLFFLDHYVLI